MTPPILKSKEKWSKELKVGRRGSMQEEGEQRKENKRKRKKIMVSGEKI